MVKVTVGHQSWCQEQFLSQDRWETKSFPQSLSYHSVGYASLSGPLKHLSPNQSSVCGGSGINLSLVPPEQNWIRLKFLS